MDDNIGTYSIKLLVLKLKFYQCSQILAINIYIKFEKATDQINLSVVYVEKRIMEQPNVAN